MALCATGGWARNDTRLTRNNIFDTFETTKAILATAVALLFDHTTKPRSTAFIGLSEAPAFTTRGPIPSLWKS